MVTPALVLLAAGLGTRFGGPKQLVPVGPHDEPLFVLTARDAVAGGVGKLVIVTRRPLRERVEALAAIHLPGVPMEIVLQDIAEPVRPIPWGTAHAVAVCASVLDGRFLVANADDHYGDGVVASLAGRVAALGPSEAIVVGYRLGGTLSAYGPVNRAECLVDDTGRVVAVRERRGLRRRGGVIVDEAGRSVEAGTLVSMNLFALGRGVATMLGERFEAFSQEHASDPTELVLPDELTALIDAGRLTMRLVPTDCGWRGLTYPEDLADLRLAVAGGAMPSD